MSKDYKPGDAVYFHHLHDDRCPIPVDGPDCHGEYRFLVEGKCRRMLVLGLKHRIRMESAKPTHKVPEKPGCRFYEATGHLGYLVLSLQSNRPTSRDFFRYQDLLDKGKTSYIVFPPVCYPVESIAQRSGQRCTSITSHALDVITKELNARKLGCPNKWERA